MVGLERCAFEGTSEIYVMLYAKDFSVILLITRRKTETFAPLFDQINTSGYLYFIKIEKL